MKTTDIPNPMNFICINIPDAWSYSARGPFTQSWRCVHAQGHSSSTGAFFGRRLIKINFSNYLSAQLVELISYMQMCSGVDENAVGACSELVFAAIDEMFPDDAQLLPSGFRIIPLDSKPVELLHYHLIFILIYYQSTDYKRIGSFDGYMSFAALHNPYTIWLKIQALLMGKIVS